MRCRTPNAWHSFYYNENELQVWCTNISIEHFQTGLQLSSGRDQGRLILPRGCTSMGAWEAGRPCSWTGQNPLNHLATFLRNVVSCRQIFRMPFKGKRQLGLCKFLEYHVVISTAELQRAFWGGLVGTERKLGVFGHKWCAQSRQCGSCRFYAAVEQSKSVAVHRRMHFNVALMEVGLPTFPPAQSIRLQAGQ